MRGASSGTYQSWPCSREKALPAHPPEQHTHWHRLPSLNLWKTKYYCKALGGFLATLSVHKVKFRGLSEQGVSYPWHTDVQEQRISCSRAGDLISISMLIYNPQHCWCSPGCFEALVFWCPLWTASSGQPSSAQSCEVRQSPVSHKTAQEWYCLKKVQTHRFIIQSFRRTLIQNHLCLGAFVDIRLKEKSARRGVVMSPTVSSPSGRRGEGFKVMEESPTCVMVQQKHLIHTYHPLKKAR